MVINPSVFSAGGIAWYDVPMYISDFTGSFNFYIGDPTNPVRCPADVFHYADRDAAGELAHISPGIQGRTLQLSFAAFHIAALGSTLVVAASLVLAPFAAGRRHVHHDSGENRGLRDSPVSF
jgi:hypothetical protein